MVLETVIIIYAIVYFWWILYDSTRNVFKLFLNSNHYLPGDVLDVLENVDTLQLKVHWKHGKSGGGYLYEVYLL
jgi:hypothetical protein